jgi:hypothetical protein
MSLGISSNMVTLSTSGKNKNLIYDILVYRAAGGW